MKDILLDNEGDIALTKDGDVSLVTSPVQAVMIKLRWYLGEWVFDPDKGIAWFEKILVKNPDIEGIKKLLIKEIMDVDDVLEVPVMNILVDAANRNTIIRFRIRTGKETYDREVVLHG